MKNFAAEFRNLASFYSKLAEDLTKFLDEDESKAGQALVKSTLQNRQMPGADPATEPADRRAFQ